MQKIEMNVVTSRHVGFLDVGQCIESTYHRGTALQILFESGENTMIVPCLSFRRT